MRFFEEVKKRMFKPKASNERGSVTMFVLIAMLFFLTVGVLLFINNMNNSAAQQRDVKKIKSEYSTADTADLDKLYEEQEEKMPNRLIVSVVDKYNQIYSASGSDSDIVWIGNANADRLPLTIKVSWPEGLPENARQIKVNGTMRSGTGNTERVVFDSSNLNVNAIGLLNALTAIRQDCDLTITAIAYPNTAQEMETEIKVKVDITNPTATISPNGGIRYINPTTKKLLDTVTITGSDNLSVTNKVEYIISTSATQPSENDENWKEYTNPIDEVPNAQDGEKYYIYSKVTDNAGNVIIAKSDEYEIIAARATFDVGTAVNAKMKTLAGNENATHETADEKITSIVYNTEIPADKMTDAYKVSSADSKLPIYMWPTTDPEDETKVVMNWYSDDDTPYLNANSAYMFSDLQAVTQIAQLNKIDTSKSTTMEKLFKDCRALTSLDLSNFDTNKVTDMSYMFHDCVTLTTLDVSSLETQNVETMAWMFAGNNSNNTGTNQLMKLTSITGLTNFNTAKVTDMNRMFYLCTNIASVDVSSFDTSKVTNMYGMFSGAYPASGQVYVKFAEIRGIENFNTSNVENMQGIFGLNSKLTSLDLSKWNTSKVTNMSMMFWYMTKLENLNISNFDTNKVTDMHWMFWNSNKLTELDLRSFDTSNVLNFDLMFRNCAQLTTIYATDSFLIKSNATSSNMFLACKKLVGGSGTSYSAEHVNADYAHIDGLNSLPGYFTNHYFIEFNANTENAQGTMTNQGIPFSYATNLKENGFTKEGYIFRGWATSPNGPVVFENGASMNYDLDGIKAVVTDAQDKADDKNVTLKLYAVWSVKHYEVTYGSPAITKPAETLEEAISIAEAGIDETTVTTATITATMDYTDNSTATISKNIVLDLAGHTITTANTITNNGTLDIYSSVDGGKITSNIGIVISNKGTFTTNKTSNTHTLTIENISTEAKTRVIQSYTENVTNTTINKNTTLQFTQPIRSGTENRYIIMSQHNTTINGATLKTATSGTSKEYGISIPSNSTTGSIIINDGTTIDVTGFALYNNGSTKKGDTPAIEVNGENTNIKSRNNITLYNALNGDVKINGGTIYSNNNIAIYNNTTGTIYLNGGAISGAANCINNNANGAINISGDNTSITSRTAKGINANTGTVTINGGTVKGETYSITAAENGKLIYNGGTLIGKSHDKTYDGREVTFDVAEANVTPITGYKPYTRQNGSLYETVLEKEITVTADANNGTISATDGWTLAQDGKTATKKVLQNTEYGTLPTKDEMERTGYTFKGWNGKNLLNLQVPESAPSDTAEANTTKRTFTPNTYVKGLAHNNYYRPSQVSNIQIQANSLQFTASWGYGVGFPLQAKANTNYVLTYNGTTNQWNAISSVMFYSKDGSLINTKITDGNGNNSIQFITPSNMYYLVIEFCANGNNTEVTITDLMLEEGTTATAYEPYIIESSTIVTQDTSHTIKAVWEAHDYKVKFDGDGATSGTMADQNFKYDEEKALTQNAYTRAYTVTYNGEQGTPAKANDTATYQFTNWGNKDILGYNVDMSGQDYSIGGRFDKTTYGNYNGYTTASVDNTSGTEYKNIVQWKLNRKYANDDKYKLTFYAKGQGKLTTFFYGKNEEYSKAGVKKVETSQGYSYTWASSLSDGGSEVTLSNDWTKYTVTYTMGSTTEENIDKYILFRVNTGNSASVYGVRFEKIENEEYQDKAVVKNLTTEDNGEVTLYAVWNPQAVTLPTATREGYIFNGWYDAATGGNKIGDAGDKYIPEANTTLHAQWEVAHYTVKVGEITTNTVRIEDAIKFAEERITGSVTTATITATESYTDNSTANITKNITIDIPAGKTITMGKTIAVSGEVTFTGTGKLKRGTVASGDKNWLINDTGRVIVNGTTLEADGNVIVGNGTHSSGTVVVNSGIVRSLGTGYNTSAALYIGTVEINGGTVSTASQDGYGIASNNITITGGTISATATAICPTKGTLTISGAQTSISGNTAIGNEAISGHSNARVTITGGTITGNNNAIALAGSGVNGTIRGGTITGSTNGITLTGANSTLTIDDNTVGANQQTPKIQGTTGYSVNITGTGSTFNYNDGLLVGKNHDKTYDGRDVTFSAADGVTVTPLTGYKPYTRKNGDLYETVLEKELTVTAEAGDGTISATDGWTLAENGKTATKKVLQNTPYGTMPTAQETTRTGYTFQGWHGKNLLNLQVPESQPSNTATETTTKRRFEYNTYVKNLSFVNDYRNNVTDVVIQSNSLRFKTSHGYGVAFPLRAKANTTYMLSYNAQINNDNASAYGLSSVMYYGEDGTFIDNVRTNGNGNQSVRFTTPNNVYYLVVNFCANELNTDVTFSNIQIEEGTTATAYEPYKIIDSSTPVTSDTDHKIYANWTANPYTVTLNAGDNGTINDAAGWTRAQDNKTATKDIIYDGAYGTLPTASRPGYNFDGWFTEATGGTEVKADTIMQTAGSVTLYPHWTARTDTPYVVNYYTHDLGAETYTLKTELTKNLQGTSDSEIEINTLKETITGHKFQAAYITGDTTKPSSGEVTSTTVAADGTRVINMYYRPNYLYVQYNMNGGSMDPNHGDKYGNSGDLVTYTNNTIHTDFRHGVYGGIVGSINNQTYYMFKDGLRNYNNEEQINIIKTGYNAKSGKEWNTKADGTGTSYNQDGITYKAIDMATACGKDLSTGDQVITLYVNWEPTPYTITYELDGGTNNAQNPATYTIESADITLQDPTKAGYIFRGWTGNGTTTPTKNLVLPHGSTENKTFTANWAQTHYNVTYGSPATTLPAETLEEAISIAEAGIDGTTVTTATITATGDYEDNSTATISKNIVIDLAGHTITRTANIVNEGTLDIYSSADNGKITGSLETFIVNKGTFTANGTSTEHSMILENTSKDARSYIISHGNAEGIITINANSTLEFTNPIETGTNDRYIITNRGTTTINGATLKTSENGTSKEHGAYIPTTGANGRIIINDGTTINTTGNAIYNNGGTGIGENPAIIINGDNTSISSTKANAVLNQKKGTININGGTFNSTSYSTIVNYFDGLINITNCTINSSGYYGVRNYASGTINVTGGSISGTIGIINETNGTINVSGENTSITGKTRQGIKGYTGTVKISDGTIQGNNHGVTVTSFDNNTGSIVITGGTVTATNNALYATENATITIGTNDGTVSKESPKVTSTATSGDYYGVYRGDTVTFNFYDGIITGYDGHSLNAQESAKPDGYGVAKTVTNGKEIAVLEKELTVTADAGDGAISATDGWTLAQDGKTATKKVLQNTEYGTLPTKNEMTRPGYTFRGWYTASTGGTEVDASTPVTSDTDHKIYANWEETPYTVTFNANGGTVNPASKEVKYNTTYGELPSGENITRTGYTFAGWYKEEELTNEVTAETTYDIANDSTLYAKWTAHPYTIHFNANGGTGEMADEAMTYDVEKALTKNTFTRNGYTFQGWSQANEGFENTLLYSNDEEMYAGHNAFSNGTREFIQYADLAPYIDRYGTKVKYRLALDIKSAKEGNNTITAYFQNGQVARYSFNHSIYNVSNEWKHVEFDFSVNGPNETQTQAMLAFYGVYGTGNKPYVKNVRLYIVPNYTDEEVVKNLTAEKNGEVTLYANWKANEYTVTADANSGTFANTDGWTVTGDTATKTVPYDSTYGTLPILAERPGYTFKGWNGKNLFNPEELIAGKNIVSDEDGNISASSKTSDPSTWSYDNSNLKTSLPAGTYTISLNFSTRSTSSYAEVRVFDDENNELLTKNLQNVDFVSEKFTLSSAKNIGIKLKLYSGVAKVQLEKSDSATTYEPYYITDDTKVVQDTAHTLTAIWQANPYTVTANANGGTIGTATGWNKASGNATATKTINYDSTYGTLPVVSKTGYTFKGWNGKNLFDEESILMAIDGATYEDGYYKFNCSKADKAYGRITGDINSNVGNKNMNITFKANTQYTLSFKGYTDYAEQAGVYETFFIGFFYTDGTSSRVDICGANEVERTLTSTAGKTVSRIATSYGRGYENVYAHIKNIQLEEGEAATTYEPYIINDTTPVTTAKAHTLTAVWDAIPYTVTYNYAENGGTSATKTTDTKIYEQAVDLTPTATKNGYTFVGWNTDKNATTALDSYSMPAGNVTLYAIYKKTFTATFRYYNNQSITRSVTIYNKLTSGNVITPAASGTPASYTFRDWSTSDAANAESTVAAGGVTEISANTTYYASYQKEVTATFNYFDVEANGTASATATANSYMNYTGTKLESNFTVPDAAKANVITPAYTLGDADGNGEIDTLDLIALKRYRDGIEIPTYAQFHAADVNEDGVLDDTDKEWMQQYLINIRKFTAHEVPAQTYTFRGVSTSDDANAASTTPTTANTVFYSSYQTDITATFNYFDVEANGTVSTTATATRYMNHAGARIEASLTVPSAAMANVTTPAYTLGDADGNGEIDTYDLMKLKRYRDGIDVPTYAQFHAADVNEDGVLDDTDKEWIQQYLINIRKFTAHEVPAQTYTFRGVSTSDDANAASTTPTTAHTAYYSSYSAEITATFNYLDANEGADAKASATATGTRYMNHAGARIEASLTVPSAAMANVTTPAYTLGDADGNGEINTFDLSALKRYRDGIDVPTYAQFHAADVNEDGVLDDTDKEWMQQYLINNRKFTAHEVPEQTYTYRGVSISDDANAASTTPTTAHTAYYSSYSAEITATFNYLDANEGADAKASATATGTRYMNYAGRREETSLTVPSTAMANVTTPAYTLGDINNDGKVNTTDNTALKRYRDGIDVPTYAQFHAADVNEDGVLDDTDKTWLQSYMIGTKRFTMKNVPIETYTYLGLSTDTNADSTVLTSANITTANTTYYAKYSRPVAITFDGNGSTSGTVANQTATQYVNAYGTTSSNTFTLPSSGYVKDGSTLAGWRIGGTSGTDYNTGDTYEFAPGATVNGTKIFFAKWQ